VPVAGAVGRDSGRLDLEVVRRPSRAGLVDGLALPATAPAAAVYADEWSPYASLPGHGRRHATVNHQRYEWARDDDGDGERAVHCNTLEGVWTGLRNSLRPFRGVNEVSLAQYVAVFGWAYNLKAVTINYLRLLLGSSTKTIPGT
jgi:hypothetical protein